MLKKDTFVEATGTWWPYIEPFFDKGGFEPIYAKLKERSGKGAHIFPRSEHTFNAFKFCTYKSVVAVWVGMCPYHTEIRGEGIADGLAFSCKNDQEAPSLKILFDAIENDYGTIFFERSPDLTFLAEQGLLLLNSSLTTERGIADSHKELWRPFTEYLAKEVFCYLTGLPIVTFGNSARDMIEPYMTNGHLYKHLKHPSFFSRNHIPMEHNNTFSWMNDMIIGNVGKEFEISFTPKI